MAKAYWIATYRAIHDPAAFTAYAKLAGPALQAAGGRFLARGNPAQVYDNAVPIEFVSRIRIRPVYANHIQVVGCGISAHYRAPLLA